MKLNMSAWHKPKSTAPLLFDLFIIFSSQVCDTLSNIIWVATVVAKTIQTVKT